MCSVLAVSISLLQIKPDLSVMYILVVLSILQFDLFAEVLRFEKIEVWFRFSTENVA